MRVEIRNGRASSVSGVAGTALAAVDRNRLNPESHHRPAVVHDAAVAIRNPHFLQLVDDVRVDRSDARIDGARRGVRPGEQADVSSGVGDLLGISMVERLVDGAGSERIRVARLTRRRRTRDERGGIGGSQQRFERQVVGETITGRLAYDDPDADAVRQSKRTVVNPPVLQTIGNDAAPLGKDVGVVTASA